MQPSRVYSHCRGAAADLSGAISSRDLRAMQAHIGTLRAHLSSREDLVDEPHDADARFCIEQLDAFEGIAETIERSLRSMRSSARREMERIEATAPLLRHLAAQPAERLRSASTQSAGSI